MSPESESGNREKVIKYGVPRILYCFTTSTVWGEYLDAREDVCLRIMETLENLGLEIAFPSQTIYMHDMDAETQPEISE